MKAEVLIVDDDTEICGLLTEGLARRGYAAEAVPGAQAALDLVKERDFDVVVADVQLVDGMNGIELCARLVEARPDVPVIVLTAHGNMETAVAAIRGGAYDFIAKPISMDAFTIALARAASHRSLKSELRRLREVVDSAPRVERIIGESPAIRKVMELVRQVAATDATVLVTGESGTGKELVARAVHELSPRHEAPFVALSCAAMTPNLLESELFGHVRGAFTDAKRSRPGLFVQAGVGTVFLDEIGEMPLEMQAKLLRVLQERKVRPVGADVEVPFEARLVAATNKDLDSEVEENRFRADLYYRINVVQLEVPPLRAREGDILLLAQHALKGHAERMGKAVVAISPPAAERLMAYDWPGNVRELENCLERAVALTHTTEITIDDLPDKIREHQSSRMVIAGDNPEDMITLAEMERRYVRRVLEAVGGNKTLAARVLGIDRRSLYRRLDQTDKRGPDS
jgi:two-component system response regulator HydG